MFKNQQENFDEIETDSEKLRMERFSQYTEGMRK